MPNPAQDSEELRRALEALTAATNNNKRRPELPAFDPKNIEIWIKRVDAAYIRANINSAKEKFAHLEDKLSVDLNPRINDFLYGDATEAKWTEFIAFLKEEYGRSTRQKVTAVLDGIQRDGRRPSHHLSIIQDQTNGLTLDDIQKEMMLRGLPPEIQRSMADKVKGLSAQQAAKLADDYFDREGKILFPSSPAINAVEQPFTGAFADPADDTTEVNAIKGRGNSRYRQPWKNGNSNSSSTATGSDSGTKLPHRSSDMKNICRYHIKWKDEAQRCIEGCIKHSEWLSKGQASRRA